MLTVFGSCFIKYPYFRGSIIEFNLPEKVKENKRQCVIAKMKKVVEIVGQKLFRHLTRLGNV